VPLLFQRESREGEIIASGDIGSPIALVVFRGSHILRNASGRRTQSAREGTCGQQNIICQATSHIVSYELMCASISKCRDRLAELHAPVLEIVCTEKRTNWFMSDPRSCWLGAL